MTGPNATGPGTSRSWVGNVAPCPCECNAGGFCGGCGHAGCGGRGRASTPPPPASSALPVWNVVLDAPDGEIHLEVPTFQGKEAAERRALVAAWHTRIADVDEITVNRSWLTGELFTPEPPDTVENYQ